MRIIQWFLLLLAIPLATAGPDLYVSAKQAELRTNPNKKMKQDKVLVRETPLTKKTYSNMWYRVTTAKGESGWIYRGKVSTASPKNDPSLTAEGGNPLAGENVAASSGIRGLGPLSQKFAGANPVSPAHRQFADYHQSYITTDKEDFTPTLTERGIELVKITSEEMENFESEGKIGEYKDAPDINE